MKAAQAGSMRVRRDEEGTLELGRIEREVKVDRELEVEREAAV